MQIRNGGSMGVGNRLTVFERHGCNAMPWAGVTREALEPMPRGLSLSDGMPPFEQAVDAWARLSAGTAAAGFRDDLAGLESCREALSLGGTAATQASLTRLLIAAAAEDRPAPRELREAFQILEAVRFGLETCRAGTGRLDAELLFAIGARLSGRNPGGRDVREAARVQQAAGEIDRLLNETARLPILVRAAMLAARIETSSPFGVASPMLARLVLPLLATASGRTPLFLSHCLAPRRADYELALGDLSAGGSWESWFTFYLHRVAEAATAATARLRSAEQLRASMVATLGTLRSHSNAHRLAELAVSMPVLTVGTAEQLLGVSFQTANAAIAALVKLDVLRPHSSVRRNRIFVLGAMMTPEPARG